MIGAGFAAAALVLGMAISVVAGIAALVGLLIVTSEDPWRTAAWLLLAVLALVALALL